MQRKGETLFMYSCSFPQAPLKANIFVFQSILRHISFPCVSVVFPQKTLSKLPQLVMTTKGTFCAFMILFFYVP